MDWNYCVDGLEDPEANGQQIRVPVGLVALVNYFETASIEDHLKVKLRPSNRVIRLVQLGACLLGIFLDENETALVAFPRKKLSALGEGLNQVHVVQVH